MKNTGLVKNLPQSGRPRAITEREDRAVVQLVKTHSHISTRDAKEMLNLNLAKKTVRNRLHEANLFRRIARNKRAHYRV